MAAFFYLPAIRIGLLSWFSYSVTGFAWISDIRYCTLPYLEGAQ